MELRRCHLCNTAIYPGEKRCLISIHIFPDQEEEIVWEDVDPEEECEPGECGGGLCNCEELDDPEEVFREAHLVLCKECQDQFLRNPLIKENLLFFKKEVETKNLH